MDSAVGRGFVTADWKHAKGTSGGGLRCFQSRPTEILVLARSPDLARVLTAGLHPSDNLDRARDLAEGLHLRPPAIRQHEW